MTAPAAAAAVDESDQPRPVSPLCFVDTETTGVGPDRQIWEIGIVRREPDGFETDLHAFLPIDLGKVPDDFGLRVGKFWDRHPIGRFISGGPTAEVELALGSVGRGTRSEDSVALAVMRITYGAHIIGAVPSFDTGPLETLLRGNGCMPKWHYHLGDVENFAVGYLAALDVKLPPPWTSAELTEALGVDPGAEDEKHTALGDVRWAMRMYDRMFGGDA